MTDLDPAARSLVDLARSADEPTDADRHRVMHALAAGIATGAAIAATASTASAAAEAAGTVAGGATLGTKFAGWLGTGVVAGLAASGAVVAVSRAMPPPAAKESANVVVAKPTGEPVPVGRIAIPRAEPVTTLVAEPAREIEAPAERRGGPPAPATSSLGAETGLLEAARAALGRGDSQGALSLLERHERAFPAGALVEERLAAKVFALCGLGRRAEAARAGAELLRRAPASPLRARVLDSCAYKP